MNWKELVLNFDERRNIAIPGNQKDTLQFCVEHFIWIANLSITNHGFFAVALSGGSTPKEIYKRLTNEKNRNRIDWTKALLFWSDERDVPLDHVESNYRMAMDAGFASLLIPKENIFPFPVEGSLEERASIYEQLIQEKIYKNSFDLMMLGMGDDGHTASLFPKTHALHPTERLVVPNFIPEKNVWRLTLTFDCINSSQNIAIYIFGESKAKMVQKVLTGPYQPDDLPIQRVGTEEHKALWILDDDAASQSVF